MAESWWRKDGTHTCRHCLAPIKNEELVLPGYKARTDWSDGHPRYPFHCDKAINFSHAPEEP